MDSTITFNMAQESQVASRLSKMMSARKRFISNKKEKRA